MKKRMIITLKKSKLRARKYICTMLEESNYNETRQYNKTQHRKELKTEKVIMIITILKEKS